MTEREELEQILAAATKAGVAYYRLTGKPLGITGEIAECQAAKLLDLELAGARTPGYDATDRQGRRIQIKARRIGEEGRKKSQQVGSIRLTHDWDAALLVLLDEVFEPFAIFEAERAAIAAELSKPGSKARNDRGALPVSTFKRIGKQVWPS